MSDKLPACRWSWKCARYRARCRHTASDSERVPRGSACTLTACIDKLAACRTLPEGRALDIFANGLVESPILKCRTKATERCPTGKAHPQTRAGLIPLLRPRRLSAGSG